MYLFIVKINNIGTVIELNEYKHYGQHQIVIYVSSMTGIKNGCSAMGAETGGFRCL